ncbi:MAG: hypothetical protein IH940_09405, partial [Acidobacteria bacterium]|nr:hypothetical protein [Acidobacteriota bacterium]
MNNIDDHLRNAGSRVEGAIVDLQSDPADIPPLARNSRIGRAGAMGLLVVALLGAGLWISQLEGDSSVQIVDPSDVQTPEFAAPYDGLESIGLPVVAEPDSGLTDGQAVVLRGTGFAPYATVGAAQCWVSGPGGSEDDCDLGFVTTGVADGDGWVEMTVSVNRFVSTAGGVFDCAEGGLDQSCVIGVGDLTDYDQSGSARVYFDPAVDGQIPPVFTVEPRSELVDGDLLRVVGDGFVPNETALITQCAYGGMNDTSACFSLNPTAEIVVGPDGRFAADIVASRSVMSPDGTTDCFSNDYGCRVLMQATRVPNPVELFYSDTQRPPTTAESTATSTTT